MAAQRPALLIAAAVITLACLGAPAQARRLLQNVGNTCPVNPATTKLDFAPVKDACVPAEGFCAACVCAVVEAFIPAFAAADLQVTEESVDAFATDASRLVVACSTTYLAPMVSAGVNITALQGLSDCTFTGAQAPACLADQLAALTGGADATKTVVPPETYYYEDVAPIPDFRDAINAPDSALARFTNVVVTDSPVASSPVPASIVADLQGQVSSMGDIVRAALANAEVAAALPVAQRTTLQALAANADFTAAPIPQDIRELLVNPILLDSLLGSIANLAGPVDIPTPAEDVEAYSEEPVPTDPVPAVEPEQPQPAPAVEEAPAVNTPETPVETPAVDVTVPEVPEPAPEVMPEVPAPAPEEEPMAPAPTVPVPEEEYVEVQEREPPAEVTPAPSQPKSHATSVAGSISSALLAGVGVLCASAALL